MGSDDVRTQTKAAVRPPGTGFVVRVARGPAAGRELELGLGARALVGQSPTCDLRLDDPHASRRHVSLEVTHHGVRAHDLGSTNGTFVNGVQIEACILHGSETLRVGESELTLERRDLPPAPLASEERFGRVVGASPAMRRLYPALARLAASDVPVVIEGETGTGKEVLAEALHEASARAPGPFVVFDCTAVPASLLESELFGHERGAFTGAVATRKGVFEQAHGGTLLIDEIGELEPALQPKLLRALERSEVRRVGGDKWIKVDVRVIAATRRDLHREVQEGRFRDDLFFRLAVARVELPPLREREGDVALLARHFFRALGGRGEPPADLLARFDRHDWPGNVRELRNAVARHLALGDVALPSASEEKPARTEGDAIDAILAQGLPLPRARELVVDAFERRYLERVLAAHGGSVARAAEASGIARRYFNVLLARARKG